MRALVTGGAGFIGSALVDRLLAEGHSVDAVDDLSSGSLANLGEARADPVFDFHFHRLDIRRPELVDLVVRRAPEVVFHLAAPPARRSGRADPRADADQHILGSLNVMEAAVAAGATKVVFASGAAIYGAVEPEELPIRETHPQRPRSFAGVAKRAVGDYLEAYRVHHELEFTSLALAHVYGPRQDPALGDGVVAVMAARLVAGLPSTIHGSGRHSRDFVYVDDAVDALARAIGRGGGLLLNVGTGVATAIEDLYATVARAAGSDHPAAFGPARAGEVDHVALDPGRAAIHLGWRPWTSLAAGVASTVDWLSGPSYRNRSSS
ncbi:MAG TPA: NAD-dependent epimerase/dehydratase family protein [Acidimicrobiales bacterium]